jgi:hypothetical protein
VSTTAPTPARRRRAPTTSREAPHTRDRQLLREVALLARRADPEELAALVTEIESTLRSCATIGQFFKTYVLALSRRRVQ